uniref:Uncharacterized protein n=1 Tax=Rhizophora mucronata TaxID=61149 RepID=A0A2P2R226_RHIMU
MFIQSLMKSIHIWSMHKKYLFSRSHSCATKPHKLE